MVHRSAMSAFRPGAVWSGVSECARGESGRRVGKVLLGAALLGIGLKVYGRYRRYQRRQRWNQAGKDVVVLHQFERGTNCPNLSPFALKLETFLRMAGIKYVVDTEEPQGSRNKCPWITFNGQELSDSELSSMF
ncbi:failed axon connections homolog [Pollicipes pollicipes]|uniref:failed axon connections homolog n=1 Tax=Pollicipes pollicipes TaxID=41117 RepID=UPI001884AEB3|nr:failed axon connections homolog [Pollicipes pollicipes]